VDVGHEALGGIPTALGLEGNAIGYITDLNGNVDIITAKEGVVASCGAPDPADPNSGSLLMVNCVRVGGCGPSPLFSRERRPVSCGWSHARIFRRSSAQRHLTPTDPALSMEQPHDAYPVRRPEA